MGWLRTALRAWLCPELLREDQKRFEKEVEEVKREIANRVREAERKIDIYSKNSLAETHNRVEAEIKILKKLHAQVMESIQGETGSMFFRLRSNKQVAVKEVVRLLLTRLRLELIVNEKRHNHELIPKLKKIKEAL